MTSANGNQEPNNILQVPKSVFLYAIPLGLFILSFIFASTNGNCPTAGGGFSCATIWNAWVIIMMGLSILGGLISTVVVSIIVFGE